MVRRGRCSDGVRRTHQGRPLSFAVCRSHLCEDAKGLIKTAARCDDPVLFLEHKRLYRHISAKAREPNADYLIPFGKGRIKRQGNAATIVTWGATVYTALEFADEFDLEVVDLRTIIPMDDEIVFNSVKKTNRVLVLHEDG